MDHMTIEKKNIYIDVDGVLLTIKNAKPAVNSIEFIHYILANFNCYWLTTHCKGDSTPALKYLNQFFDNIIIEKLKTVKTTNWSTLKTEAIDLNFDFFWIEDYPFQAEINILEYNNKKDNLIIVDLNQPNELLRIIELLKNSISTN
jgi:hypothetical protein